MKPNKRNFCGGNFQDWVEVMLTEKCNGSCSWCVEKRGWHPKERVSWQKIASAVPDKKNVILLGGEPTLFNGLRELINYLVSKEKNVYMTTNGSTLTPQFVRENLSKLSGINISIHDCQLSINRKLRFNERVTGILLEEDNLLKSIEVLKENGTVVRFNCNLIKGHIDSKEQIERFVDFAKRMGVDSLRFAELKFDDERFVDLHSIYGTKYGINNEPYGLGCNTDCKINNMPVNFRQMCGLQTTKRVAPKDPERCKKQVLYYDGNIYDGWQLQKEKAMDMDEKKLNKLLRDVAEGTVKPRDAAKQIKGEAEEKTSSSYGCVY